MRALGALMMLAAALSAAGPARAGQDPHLTQVSLAGRAYVTGAIATRPLTPPRARRATRFVLTRHGFTVKMVTCTANGRRRGSCEVRAAVDGGEFTGTAKVRRGRRMTVSYVLGGAPDGTPQP